MRIYEHKDWPKFTWDDAQLAPKLADIRYKQGKLLGRLGHLGFEFRQEASLKVLTSDVVKSSAIEGEILDPQEVRSSIARRLGVNVGGLVPVGRDVEGIVDMMLDATKNYNKPLTAERLFGWHAALFPTGYSGIHKISVAQWRKDEEGPMRVVSGALGREKVHYEAPPAKRFEKEMKQFINWFDQKSSLDPVLKAGLAHFWFVTIHPFDDGNGRIARALADMALARADQTEDRFYSMSTQIKAEQKEYYRQLERQQHATPDVTAWLMWFLDCLGRSFDRVDDVIATVLFKWTKVNQAPLNQRQQDMLMRMLDENFEGYMNTSKYAKMAKCSHDTALRDIQGLVEAGILVKNPGGGRSTSYRVSVIF